ncbi:MAG: hypothetical protein DCF32_17320 [Leptolyngbya sp.]|nr:MAG: hypothetical protein DCF32_17320 [Leptolyngbya sp.]
MISPKLHSIQQASWLLIIFRPCQISIFNMPSGRDRPQLFLSIIFGGMPRFAVAGFLPWDNRIKPAIAPINQEKTQLTEAFSIS